MSRSSHARRQRRAVKASGAALLDRVAIDSDALAAAVTKGADLVDLVAYHVAEAIGRLDAAGADIVNGYTVVSIGAHPDFPGAVTVEAKAGKLKSAELDEDGL